MMGERRGIQAIVMSAAALLVTAPAALSAQVSTQSYAQCGTGTQACYGARLTLNTTTNTLTLLLQSNGTTPSRITGFALFENPLSSVPGTLAATFASAAFFDGETNSAGALPSGFSVSSGAPNNGAFNGVPTPNLAFNLIGGSSGGVVSCAGTNGGSGTKLTTCSNVFAEALQVTFTNVSGVTSADQIGLAIRFQSVANAQGQGDEGSLRCISTGGQNNNCSDVPGGGITGQVVPEPSTYVLLGSGLLGLAGIARRRRQG